MANREVMNRIDMQERRLKIIYDALDLGSLKKAIHESDKVLKKDPACHTAKVLKSIALLRSGHPVEASQIISQLLGDHFPTEESTVHALTFYFKESGQSDRIGSYLREACKKCPDREDLLTQLFFADVRTQDFKEQQATARKLHKLFPTRNEFYFWIIMSTVMQGKENEAMAVKVYLPLAEKMLSKLVNDNIIDSDKELDLYLLILEKLNRFQDAKDLIESGILDKMTNSDRIIDSLAYRLDYNKRLSNHSAVVQICQELINSNPDDWIAWESYIEAIFQLNKASLVGDNHSFESAHTLINTYLVSSGHMRGPYLALMRFTELICAATDFPTAADTAVKIQTVEEQITTYFNKFGHKPVAGLDLADFLPRLIEDNERQKQMVMSLSKDIPSAPFANVAMMERNLCIQQLNRLVGLHRRDSISELAVLLDSLLESYWTSLHFGSELKTTELQPADGFLNLAVSILHDMWRIDYHTAGKPNHAYLHRAAVLLEAGLKASPFNHHFKIRLVRIHSLLGNFSGVLKAFENLDVKQIMWESIGYLLTEDMTRLGQYPLISLHLANLIKLQRTSAREIEDSLVTAYKNSAFRKVMEFSSFHVRLQRSWMFDYVKYEHKALRLVISPNSFEQLLEEIVEFSVDPSNEFCSSLIDGRDFINSPSFDPPEISFSQEDQQKSFEDEITWLKFRHMLVQFILVTAKLTMSTGLAFDNYIQKKEAGLQDADIVNKDPDMMNLCDKLIVQLENMRNSQVPKQNYSILGQSGLLTPNMTVSTIYLHGSFCEVLKQGALLTKNLLNIARENCQNPDSSEISSNFDSIVSALQTEFDILFPYGASTQCDNMAVFLPRLCSYAESFSLVHLFSCMVETSLRPITAQNQQTRRKKKGKKKVSEEEAVDNRWSGIVTATKSFCKRYGQLMSDAGNNILQMKNRLDIESLSKTLAENLGISCNGEVSGDAVTSSDSEQNVGQIKKPDLSVCQEVARTIYQGYYRSLDELQQLIDAKLRYTSCLCD